ncbi:signal peptidase II [Myxococcota bacterium]|nr:signal peptidase II [Myxococcota bacterium]
MGSRWRTLIIVGLTVFVLDQWTKLLAVQHLTPGVLAAHAAETGKPAPRLGTEEADAVHRELGLMTELGYFYTSPQVVSPCRGPLVRCDPVRVFDGFWDWRYAENPGAAWSMFAKLEDPFRIPFLVGVSCIAIFAIIVFMRSLDESQKLTFLALSLITGGAFGNLLDRARLGYVIDFVDWYVGTTHWPIFNVADVGVSTGVGLIMLGMLLDLRKKQPDPSRGDTEPLASSTR